MYKIEYREKEWFVNDENMGKKVDDVVERLSDFGKTFIRTACSCAKDFDRPIKIAPGAIGGWIVVLLEKVPPEPIFKP